SFSYCEDTRYSMAPRDFWWSLAVTHGLAWTLTLLACWIVPRTWGDKPAPAPSRRWRWRNLGRMLSYGSPAKCAAFRKRALDVNAFYWLAGRARLKPLHVWIFMGCIGGWWIRGWWKSGNYWLAEETFFATGYIVNSALKLWVAMEAGQRLGEDRRAGSFELLLATPLQVGDFLRGQILALRRQFFRPLLLVTVLEVVLAIVLKRRGTINTQELCTAFAGVVMLGADVLALPWVAMAAALTFKSQTQATSFTVARIFILPWVIFGFIVAVLTLLVNLDLIRWHPGDWFGLGLWFGTGLAVDFLFGLRSWRTLRRDFRTLAVQSFLPEPPRPPWWRNCWTFGQWTGRLVVRCVPPRVRKQALALLVAIAAVTAVVLLRRSQPHFPPPVLVSITQSNAPIKFFPGGGSGVFFVMPDGTLWQWGKPGAPQSPRALVPEQIGTGHDWVKVVGAGTHCLGLRADGTIWGWGFSNGRYNPEPQLAVAGHDWIDFGTGTHHAAGIKRDGTLWIWNEPLVVNDAKVRPILAFQVAADYSAPFQAAPALPKTNLFSPTHWISVYCGPESTFALQKNGTLWAQGRFSPNSISSYPTLVCADTNWTTLDANGLARNQDGQLWEIRNANPNPQAGVAAVCAAISPDLTPDSRPGWLALWSLGETGFGLTADGTIWTWGADLGQEPPKTYESRLELLRSRLTGMPPPKANKSAALLTARPRPLLKLVGGTANPIRK
ncbi:MAG TPA: hypothetical protein VK731_10920, partial [Candidatus Cybelea sp.]|nr:hypothetical protein [Candidatus Cybelea sp.]